jgi:small subunit ribosomal protein S6
MFRYEVLFLTVPEITKDESENIKSHFTKVIRAHKGAMVSFDRWGKYRLAYPVNKNEYGVYFLTRFEVDFDQKESLLAAIKETFVFKFNTLIPKHIIERLDPVASLEYRRPDSLEDNPQDVDTFLKRNEMEGLIKKSSRKGFAAKDKTSSTIKEVEDDIETEDMEDIE